MFRLSRSWSLSRALLMLVFSGLFGFLSVTYVTQKWPASVTARETVHLDGYYYYTYLRSLAFDGDVDFSNDYALLASNIYRSPNNAKTGKPENMFTVGPALFWSPLAAVGRVWLKFSDRLGPPDGSGAGFQKLVFFGSSIYGFLSVLLMFAIQRTAYRTSDALLACLAGLFCTPLWWFMTRQACYSHAISAFTSALLVFAWLKSYGSWSVRRWLALGFILGLGMDVRPQGVVQAAVPGLEIAVAAWLSFCNRDGALTWRWLRAGALFALGSLIGFAPQMLSWHSIYGSYWVVPQGDTFMLWGGSRYGAVFFSSWNGWSAWHPLVSLGLLGLIIAALRGSLPPQLRLLARASLLVIATQAFLNGAAGDWWAGWSFGGRRFTDCTVFIALGLAQLFSLLGDSQLHAALSRVLRVALPATVVLSFGLVSADLGSQYLHQQTPLDQPFNMLPYWQGAVTRGMAYVYELTGNWGSIPANWVYASTGMVSPARYDLGSTRELRGPAELVFADSPHVLGGFGVPTQHNGRPVRWLLAHEGRVDVVLRTPGALRGSVELAAAVPGTRVRMSLRGRTLLRTKVSDEFETFDFEVPVSVLSPGSNFVRIEQRLPKQGGPHPVGKTGVSIRSDLTVRTAGWFLGAQASIELGSEETAVTARGLSLFTLASDSQTLHLVGEYDTFLSPDAAAALERDVERIPAGTVAVLVARDEASLNFTEQGDRAIRNLGGKETLRSKYRAGYALVGVRGAAPGSALESWSVDVPVEVSVGRKPFARRGATAWHVLKLDLAQPPSP